MDYFDMLSHFLKDDAVKNLEILHNCEVVTVTSGYTNTQKLFESDLSNTLNVLLLSYNYKKLIEDVENKLIRDGNATIIVVWDNKIIILYLELTRCCKFCGIQKYDYKFKTTSYFLDLQIKETIFDSQLKNILKWPTKAKIRSFVENN